MAARRFFNRTRVARVVADLAAGAVLGVLVFLAARTLGFPFIFGWFGFGPLIPVAIIAALIFATPLRGIVWIAAALLVIVVVLSAFTPAMTRPARALVRADTVGAFDAVTVLSSGLNDDDLISQDAVDRTLSGFALARSRVSDSLPNGVPVVFTVVIRGRERARTSAADQQRIAELAGGGLDVHFTDPVHSTRDEARIVGALARAEGWERLAVVTSPLHTRRACAAFERAGVSVTCVPAEARDFAANTLKASQDRVRATQLLFYEVAGTLYYKVRGWI